MSTTVVFIIGVLAGNLAGVFFMGLLIGPRGKAKYERGRSEYRCTHANEEEVRNHGE